MILNFEPDNFSTVAKKMLQQHAAYAEVSWEDIESNSLINEATAIIVRFKKYLDGAVLSRFAKLKVIVSATTGTDHIDVAWCNKHKITILCLKPYTEFLKTIPSTAEHSFALLLSLMRNIPAAVSSVKNGNWQRELFWGQQLKNKKIGIVGMGRTGSFMAKYAAAFDMYVYYYDPYVILEDSSYVKTEDINDLILLSDIISLHVHISDETKHLINPSLSPYFNNTKYIINTSRGAIVDEHFVYQLLKTKKLAGIASDVIDGEINGINESPLIKALNEGENVLITPHIGGATYDALHSCEEFICGKLVELMADNHFN